MTPTVPRRPGWRTCLPAAASTLCHAAVITLMIGLGGGPAGEFSVTPDVELRWTPPDRQPEAAEPAAATGDSGAGAPAQLTEAATQADQTIPTTADAAPEATPAPESPEKTPESAPNTADAAPASTPAQESPQKPPEPAPDIAEAAPMPVPPPPPMRTDKPKPPAKTSRTGSRPPSMLPGVVDAAPATSQAPTPAGAEGSSHDRGPGSGITMSLDGALKAYARTIWMKIQRARPTNAADPGIAVVAFAVAADGSIAWARITATSGLPTLDRTALDTVRRAAPLPPPPPGAAPEQLVFSVPFSYR